MISELRRDRAVRFSYQCGGPAPTAPPVATTSMVLARVLRASSSSFPSRKTLSATSTGRSRGIAKLSSVVQTPSRSGSPHGVLGCVHPPCVSPGASGRCPAGRDKAATTTMASVSKKVGRLFFLEVLVKPFNHFQVDPLRIRAEKAVPGALHRQELRRNPRFRQRVVHRLPLRVRHRLVLIAMHDQRGSIVA